MDLNVLNQAVMTLHADQMKPTAADIARRFTELTGEKVSLAPRIILQILEESDPNYELVFEAEIYLTYVAMPDWFQGFICPRTAPLAFPEECFTELSELLVTMLRYPGLFQATTKGLQSFEFKGGRYAVARFLLDKVSFGSNFSLGKLCRFVQLAIDRGLLTYENNLLMPPAACTALSSAVVSKLCLPILDDDDSASESTCIATVPELAAAIEVMLRTCGRDGLLLSTVKKRMVEEFNRSLRPPRLGYTKLLDLIMQEKSILCAIYRDRNHKILLYPSHWNPAANFVEGFLVRLR